MEGYIMAKRKKKIVKRNICEVHYEIKDLAEDIEDEFAEFVTKKALKKIQRIQTLIEEALEYGQSMENRLMEYKKGELIS